MDSKTCTKCGETKPLDEYYKDKGGKYGRRSNCKACAKAQEAEYNARPAVKARRSEWGAAYYAENRDTIRAQRAGHRARPEVKARYAEYRAEHRHIYWESAYRTRARAFGLEPVVESFTRDELTARWGDACYLCSGEWDELEHVTPVSRGGEHSLSNCRPVCEPCNHRAWAEYRRTESA